MTGRRFVMWSSLVRLKKNGNVRPEVTRSDVNTRLLPFSLSWCSADGGLERLHVPGTGRAKPPSDLLSLNSGAPQPSVRQMNNKQT